MGAGRDAAGGREEDAFVFSSNFEGCENRLENSHTPTHTHIFPEFLALKHEGRILGHSSSPVCGSSMTEQVRLCVVWPIENWLGSSLNQIQGCTTVQESYSRALEQGPLVGNWRVGRGKWKPREVFSKWPFGLVRGAAQVTNIRRWGFSGNASQQRGAALHQLITELMS